MYEFDYDYLDRLTAARYFDVTESNGLSSDSKFNTGYSYDARGNLLSITRRGQHWKTTRIIHGVAYCEGPVEFSTGPAIPEKTGAASLLLPQAAALAVCNPKNHKNPRRSASHPAPSGCRDHNNHKNLR
jgi:YD repeat-containing protein